MYTRELARMTNPGLLQRMLLRGRCTCNLEGGLKGNLESTPNSKKHPGKSKRKDKKT